MEEIASTILYMLVFLSVYVQVFFLVTFFENRKKLVIRNGKISLLDYPKVTIIVPCWNEENTLQKTVQSLLDLNYPQDKLEIFIVDDGSTDSTWHKIQEFQIFKNVKIFQKENGGKHTALNLGLLNADSDFVACLDADSVADSDSLVRIMSYFEKDINTMAVSPTILVRDAQNVLQHAQKAEYYMAVYTKKMLALLGAIHVTPGPLTVFRKKVFDDLGGYRHAHNTEDMEIAYRMQVNGYKIDQCNDAYVYTSSIKNVKKLYKQRLRWIYGFINNTIDYRQSIFKKKFGNFSIFTVPSGIISVFAASFLFGKLLYFLGEFIYNKYFEFRVIGFNLGFNTNFDPFFINTKAIIFLTIILYALVISAMIIGRKMANTKRALSLDLLYFLAIYSVIAPFWLVKAVYNTVISKKPAWR